MTVRRSPSLDARPMIFAKAPLWNSSASSGLLLTNSSACRMSPASATLCNHTTAPIALCMAVKQFGNVRPVPSSAAPGNMSIGPTAHNDCENHLVRSRLINTRTKKNETRKERMVM